MGFLDPSGSRIPSRNPQQRSQISLAGLLHIGLSAGAPSSPTTLPKIFTDENEIGEIRSACALVLGETIDQLYHSIRCPNPIGTTESRHLSSSGLKLLQHWDPVHDQTKKMYIVKKTGH